MGFCGVFVLFMGFCGYGEYEDACLDGGGGRGEERRVNDFFALLGGFGSRGGGGSGGGFDGETEVIVFADDEFGIIHLRDGFIGSGSLCLGGGTVNFLRAETGNTRAIDGGKDGGACVTLCRGIVGAASFLVSLAERGVVVRDGAGVRHSDGTDFSRFWVNECYVWISRMVRRPPLQFFSAIDGKRGLAMRGRVGATGTPSPPCGGVGTPSMGIKN